MNGELDGTTSLHPSKTDITIEFPSENPGQYSIELVIEGAAPGELQKLMKGEIAQPAEEIRAHAKWDITVATVDNLYQTDAEKLAQVGKDVLALYSAGVLGFKACKTLWRRFEEVSEEEEEFPTLDDFRDE